MPKTLLIVANRPSPNTAALADAALAACQNYDGGDIETRCLTPFEVTAPNLFKADAVVIGTTENIGYMAGATKDMFDRCYNDRLQTGAGVLETILWLQTNHSW